MPLYYGQATAAATGSAGAAGTPITVASTDTYLVPDNTQALFRLSINVNGWIQTDGYLVES